MMNSGHKVRRTSVKLKYRIWEKLLENSLIEPLLEKIRKCLSEKIVQFITRQTMRAVGVILEHHPLKLDKALDNYLLVVGTVKEAAHVSALCRSPQINQSQKLRNYELDGTKINKVFDA